MTPNITFTQPLSGAQLVQLISTGITDSMALWIKDTKPFKTSVVTNANWYDDESVLTNPYFIQITVDGDPSPYYLCYADVENGIAYACHQQPRQVFEWFAHGVTDNLRNIASMVLQYAVFGQIRYLLPTA